jgi:hypothetical protein
MYGKEVHYKVPRLRNNKVGVRSNATKEARPPVKNRISTQLGWKNGETATHAKDYSTIYRIATHNDVFQL